MSATNAARTARPSSRWARPSAMRAPSPSHPAPSGRSSATNGAGADPRPRWVGSGKLSMPCRRHPARPQDGRWTILPQIARASSASDPDGSASHRGAGTMTCRSSSMIGRRDPVTCRGLTSMAPTAPPYPRCRRSGLRRAHRRSAWAMAVLSAPGRTVCPTAIGARSRWPSGTRPACRPTARSAWSRGGGRPAGDRVRRVPRTSQGGLPVPITPR